MPISANLSKLMLCALLMGGASFSAAQNSSAASVSQSVSGQSQAITPAQRENYDPLLDLPPLPNKRVTLIGGTVSSLDEVMNRMVVQPFGSKQKMNVAFDTRTHFFSDGKPISYKDIQQGQRVYLDTMLNGTKVFAKNIWIQTATDSGIVRGQIMGFDPQKSILTVHDELSSQPLKLQLTPATVIHEEKQTGSPADLTEGALVSLSFGPNRQLREIALLAKPGSAFTFAGRVTYLDLSRKIIAVDNQSDRVKYDITLDAIPASILRQLREGQQVAISAVFDGNKYDARRIDLPSAPGTQP